MPCVVDVTAAAVMNANDDGAIGEITHDEIGAVAALVTLLRDAAKPVDLHGLLLWRFKHELP